MSGLSVGMVILGVVLTSGVVFMIYKKKFGVFKMYLLLKILRNKKRPLLLLKRQTRLIVTSDDNPGYPVYVIRYPSSSLVFIRA